MSRSTSKSVAVLQLGYRNYAVPPTQAAKLIELLGKLEPVKRVIPEEGPMYWIPDQERRDDIEIKFGQSFEARERLLALPAPVRGAVACPVCNCDGRPGKPCPGCGTTIPRRL